MSLDQAYHDIYYETTNHTNGYSQNQSFRYDQYPIKIIRIYTNEFTTGM